MTTATELRLSAQSAFLGRIHSGMRLIKVKFEDDWIVVSIVLDREPTPQICDDISEATTEIVADFLSPIKIREKVTVSTEPLANEDVFAEGWVYRRAE